jgi:hypothetical protein
MAGSLLLGPLAFAAPWLLLGLLALPVIWWLLRLTPPAPLQVVFPAIRLLRDLINPEETPAKAPPWLLLLRLLIAGLLVLALSRPVLNPDATLPGDGPLLLVVDNGWAAGRDWSTRQQLLGQLIDQAERSGRAVVVLPTARPASADPVRRLGPMSAADARRLVQALQPLPWATDRAGAFAALDGYDPRAGFAVWLADGLGDGLGDGPSATALQQRLQRIGGLEIAMDEQPTLLMRAPRIDGDRLVAVIERAVSEMTVQPVSVRAVGSDGRLLAHASGRFETGQNMLELALDLPTELRNEATALRLDGQSGAGSVLLLDERWRRRPVGLISGRSGDAQPLLSDLYYLEQALSPFAEVRRGTAETLLQRETAVLILTDAAGLSMSETELLIRWIEGGGTLLRFAGPLLARGESGLDSLGPGGPVQNQDLLPVQLRRGDRRLGGALSWEEPARLAAFPAGSPFHGLTVPPDVTVSRQVLAEPALDLAGKTWARLQDGTPLVTADRHGQGRVVLIHTTAGPDWSTLSLSGLFVDMLRRIVALSAGVGGADGRTALPPFSLLDGQGRLTDPPATAFPLPAGERLGERLGERTAENLPGPRNPPGFYGNSDAAVALNLTQSVPPLAPLQPLPGVRRSGLLDRGELDLMPALLTLATLLAILDLFVGLYLRGLLPRLTLRKARPALLLLLTAGLLSLAPPAARAQSGAALDVERAVEASTRTWLAYVVTGDNNVDATSQAGLKGLSEELNRRTAVETAGSLAVDLEKDELSFFPLLYWPVTEAQAPPSEAALSRLNAYLRNGGLIILDTRDQGFSGAAGGGERLTRLTRGLEIPPLAPIPPEHVLTRAFYLLRDFPGRQTGGPVWVEAAEGRVNDGVSSVIIGAHDWAGAWAVNTRGRPMFPVVPGDERQREAAYRFGINVVMYALTGNYKADQVHVPAILERLGQ